MRCLGPAPVLVLVLWLAGCAPAARPQAAGTGEAALAGVAVVCSDYTSTAVAIVNPDATRVTAPLLIDSGSTAPGVSEALSGDVELPTVADTGGPLVLLDRYPNAVLTWVDSTTGQVLRQVAIGEGFAANPHDVLHLADGRWLVTRYGVHGPGPGRPGDLGHGDDLLVLAADGTPSGNLPMSDADGFPGRPDRMLTVDGEGGQREVWVALGRGSRDFRTWREGAVARVRVPAGGAPALIGRVALPGGANCGALATDGREVAVVCSGAYRTGTPTSDRSEVLLLDPARPEQGPTARLSGDDPRVEGAFVGAVAFGVGGVVYVPVFGDSVGRDDGPDRVLAWLPGQDSVTVVYRASAAFTVSSLTTTVNGDLIVPDANPERPRICVLGRAPPRCLAACDATGLPPRVVRRLVPPAGGAVRIP